MPNGLPHYTNSRISVNNWDPVYLNLFTVILELPLPLQQKYPEPYVYLEQIKKVSGLETDKISGVGAEQNFKFASRRFAKSKPDNTVVDLEIEFEVNVSDDGLMYPYNVFRDWSKLIYDAETGNQSKKKNYVGSMVIRLHDKEYNVLKRWNFPTVFISEQLPSFDLDYSTEEVFVMPVKFAADFWRDPIRG
jgi:hypothetical protein